MNKILPLLAFGLGLIGAGSFFTLFDESLSYFTEFIIEDKYYLFMESIWSVFPAIIIFIGIIFLVVVGVEASKKNIGDMY